MTTLTYIHEGCGVFRKHHEEYLDIIPFWLALVKSRGKKGRTPKKYFEALLERLAKKSVISSSQANISIPSQRFILFVLI